MMVNMLTPKERIRSSTGDCNKSLLLKWADAYNVFFLGGPLFSNLEMSDKIPKANIDWYTKYYSENNTFALTFFLQEDPAHAHQN